MKIALIGQRDWKDEILFDSIWRKLASRYGRFTVVTGDACGADLLARTYARLMEHPLIVHRADWATDGRKAGPIRNTLIIADSDLVIAFWGGQSRGTRDSLIKAATAGKPNWVIAPDGRRYRFSPAAESKAKGA